MSVTCLFGSIEGVALFIVTNTFAIKYCYDFYNLVLECNDVLVLSYFLDNLMELYSGYGIMGIRLVEFRDEDRLKHLLLRIHLTIVAGKVY